LWLAPAKMIAASDISRAILFHTLFWQSFMISFPAS
jgi:hypothetical protein